MLIDIAAPLTAGQTFTITLTFAEAGEQEVTVEVRDDV
jgi:copper(I)-binding protein